MNIKNFRTSQLLTIGEFAEKVGVSWSAVAKWEKGGAIRISNLRRIAQAFNLSTEQALLLCNQSTKSMK